MSENYFQNLPSRTKINDLTLAPLIVDDISYSFTDYIENEYVSDFPTYSQRVRNIVKQCAVALDTYLTELDRKLGQMELGVKGDYSNWTNARQNELSVKINEMDSRITRFDELQRGSEATDTNLGLITLNRINGLIDTKLNGVGLATSSVSNVDLQSYFATRLFQSNSSSKINGKTTVGINWQYDSTWGVQLGITEEESPKLYIRSKQRGTWRGWNEMATVESVNNVKSALERKIEEKINERIGNFDDIWRGL